MCGIAGLITDNATIIPARIIHEMTERIHHRGPDDYGTSTFSTGADSWRGCLGHRRLAIIDLEGGHQPMTNEDQSVRLVFNGEIYNYIELKRELANRGCAFRTRSDTEVVLRAFETYGERCVDHLQGMFAFAVWNTNDSSLFLARDRFGEKPLYYFQTDTLFAFASEIKALLAVPGLRSEINHNAIYSYLLYRYVPSPETLFQGVYKLPPGTTAVWRDRKLSIQRYYSPPDRYSRPVIPVSGTPVAGFLRLLDRAVRLRMRSDVPFGAFLSGGLDSSAVVALMSRHNGPPVKTFSIGFAETGYDESLYARRVAAHFRTEHHELQVSADDLMGKLPELVGFRDAPVSEPSDIPIFLLSEFARREVKMVLTGEGSDELLGGYPKHVFEHHNGICRAGRSLGRRPMETVARILPYRYHRLQTALRSLCLPEFTERMPRWFGACSREDLSRLLTGAYREPQIGTYFHFDRSRHNSLLRQTLFFDQTSWLPDNLLERADRMSMAHSLEIRLPYLDHVLAGYVSSLPDRYRVRGWRTKWILREAMRTILPRAILERPKIGFKVPVNVWFRTSMRTYLYELLTGPDSRTNAYFRPRALRRILSDHVRQRENHEKLLWTLLNLEIWHRRYAS